MPPLARTLPSCTAGKRRLVCEDARIQPVLDSPHARDVQRRGSSRKHPFEAPADAERPAASLSDADADRPTVE
jgi:hypothetical protein